MSATLSSDHHDDARGDARRVAARARDRRRRRAPPSTRHLDCRRAFAEPIADSLHNAGRVSVSRSIPAVVLAPLWAGDAARARPTSRHAGGLIVMRPRPTPLIARAAAMVLLAIAGCTVGPDYVRPTAEAPAAYKEMPPAKTAAPADASSRGQWWEVYGDAKLNELEEGVAAANQNLRAAEANYRQAQAAVQAARAGLYPTIGASVDASRVRQGGRTQSLYSLGLPVDWEVDLWGKIRRSVEASEESAQASAADLEASRLSLQAQLAQSYFGLRIADRQKKLVDETVAACQR